MDLEKYSLEDLILSAVESEIDAKEIYSNLAESVKNYFLKDRLKFLSQEEEKHRVYLTKLYTKNFPSKELMLPEISPVPMPNIAMESEGTPLSDVLTSAMGAESAASEFYSDFAKRFPSESEENRMLVYLSGMEMGHYKILEIEKQNALKFEEFDQVWPMMHAGP
jgi:rubrerythrin